jgi:hypothetical protein
MRTAAEIFRIVWEPEETVSGGLCSCADDIEIAATNKNIRRQVVECIRNFPHFKYSYVERIYEKKGNGSQRTEGAV